MLFFPSIFCTCKEETITFKATFSGVKDQIKYSLFFIVILLSRVPFLFNGYGLDGDAWAVGLAAQHWSSDGVYEASRFPGYPLHEFLARFFISEHYFTLNFLTAIVSSLGILFFVMTLRELKFRSSFLAGLALAFVPVIYIQSTTALDYCLAMAFQLIALYFLIKGKNVIAGILVGLAIGVRITSGAMLLPFVIMAFENDGIGNNLKRMLRLVVPALIVGAICFIPVYMRYGFSFLNYYDVPYPSLSRVLYKLFIEVWGIPGMIALLFAVVILFVPDRWTSGNYLFPRSVNAKYVVAWLVAIDLYIIAFIKLPMESGYLIPMVPFVILLFGRFLVRPAFGIFCLLLISASFFMSVSPTDRVDVATPTPANIRLSGGDEEVTVDFLRGPVMNYELRRKKSLEYFSRVLSATDTFSHRAVLITGQWYNPLISIQQDTISGKVRFLSHVDEKQLLECYAKGNELYFLDRQHQMNKMVKGVDPEMYGAHPLLIQ